MYKTYTTVSGDKWDGIAFKTLGNEMYADSLIKLNPKYRHIFIFSAGTVLLIPTPTESIPNQSPPWKRGIE